MNGRTAGPTVTPRRNKRTENGSDNLPIFWGLHHKFFPASVLCSLGLIAGWVCYGWWVLGGRDTQLKVIVAIILCCSTLLAIPLLVIFTVAVLVLPLAILHCIYALVLSRWIVATYQFGKDKSVLQQCKLCSKCQTLVASPLIAGTPWILTKSSHYLTFHDTENLRVSADDCHLCSLLWHSIVANSQPRRLPGAIRSGTTAPGVEANSFESLPFELTPITNLEKPAKSFRDSFIPDTFNKNSRKKFLAGEQLNVKIWVESFCLRKPVLRMQICGGPISSSSTLRVDWSTAFEDPSRHKCFHSQQTDSLDIAMWASLLIEECHQSHENCRPRFVSRKSKQYLPWRLLDVDNGTKETISLIATTEPMSPAVEYLALSHCWGGTTDFQLTEDKLVDMDIIYITKLPSTFQDAVSVTRRLGVRYLWIDSLCIVQDDEKEWAVQSGNMGLVYANAKCVISATDSKDSNGGLFRSRDLYRDDCTIRQKGTKQLVVRSQDDPNMLDLFEEKVERAPLTKRAWALQERYLATRTLHFCAGSVLFECSKLMASDQHHSQAGPQFFEHQATHSDGKHHSQDDCELALHGIPPTHPSPGTIQAHKYGMSTVALVQEDDVKRQYNVNSLVQESARFGMRATIEALCRFSDPTDPFGALDFHSGWYEVVGRYSSRSLTRSEDKLMAMVGIAGFIQTNTGMAYNSGLWEGTLSLNMLWAVSGRAKPRPQRAIPTWSWASVDGTICHRLKEAKTALEEHQCQCPSSWEFMISRLPQDIKVITLDTVNNMVLNSRLEMTANLWKYMPGRLNEIWDIHVPPTEGLFVLPILSFGNRRVHPLNSGKQLHGIVLQNISGDMFQRVGYFWVTEGWGYEIFAEDNHRQFQKRKIILV